MMKSSHTGIKTRDVTQKESMIELAKQLGCILESFIVPKVVISMEEALEGDTFQMQHVIELWKMDLPSLTSLIIKFNKEMKGILRNMDAYIKDLQIQKSQPLDHLDKISDKNEVLRTHVELTTKIEGQWEN
jgi:hypothetical protein